MTPLLRFLSVVFRSFSQQENLVISENLLGFLFGEKRGMRGSGQGIGITMLGASPMLNVEIIGTDDSQPSH